MPGSRKPEPRNPLHPKKLLLSKWTARTPQHREKHFLVTKVEQPAEPGAAIEWVELEAVISRRSQRLHWRDLTDAAQWLPGWR